MNTRITVAENVDTLRRRAGLTQEQLAKLAGINRNTLGAKLSHRNDWDTQDLDKLADALGVTVAELVTAVPTAEEWAKRNEDRPSLIASLKAVTGLMLLGATPLFATAYLSRPGLYVMSLHEGAGRRERSPHTSESSMKTLFGSTT